MSRSRAGMSRRRDGCHIARASRVIATLIVSMCAAPVFAQRATSPVSPTPSSSAVTSGAMARIVGEAFDSVAMQPLAGAVVQLVSVRDPSQIRSATTGMSGRFAFDSIAFGTYLLGLIHDRLDTLGIEGPLHRVDVQNADDVDARLAIPSVATIIAQRCGPAPTGQTPSMFVGVVRSALGPILTERARVRAQWTELLASSSGIERRNPSRFIEATESGFFAICGVPTDGPVIVRAFAGADSSGVVELAVPRNGLLVRDLYVGPAEWVNRMDPTSIRTVRVLRGNGRLLGYVRTEDGRPLAGARIGLWDAPADTTNVDGQFALQRLPTGTYTLEARALGFQVARKTVDVFETAAALLDVVMDPLAPVLDAVKVKARADAAAVPLADFERRKKGGFGHFMDEAQIRKRAALTTADLFRATPGMTIMPGPESGDKVLMRNAASGGSCVPAVFLNGMLVPTDGSLDAFVNPSDVRGIEVYARTSVPLEFQSRNECGSLVLWTGSRRTQAKR